MLTIFKRALINSLQNSSLFQEYIGLSLVGLFHDVGVDIGGDTHHVSPRINKCVREGQLFPFRFGENSVSLLP